VPPTRRLLAFVLIGLVCGFLSGMFGVGGGVLIVPALVLLLHYDQKVASGTSLIAVAPIAAVGATAYAVSGHIDWVVSLFLAIGMVAGGVIGSWLLARLHTIVISWIFIGVLVVIAIRMFFADPERGAPNPIDPWDIAALIAIGIVVGTLSGLLGVGGGVIIVPTLIVFYGFDDLFAKGASFVALLPNALTSSIINLRRRHGDLIAGAAIGLAGAATAWPGMLVAEVMDPQFASILFAVFLLLVALQLALRTLRRSRAKA
jgi:uncharacterized membrane protein YfcA